MKSSKAWCGDERLLKLGGGGRTTPPHSLPHQWGQGPSQRHFSSYSAEDAPSPNAPQLTWRIRQRWESQAMSSHGRNMPRVTQLRRMTNMLIRSNQVSRGVGQGNSWQGLQRHLRPPTPAHPSTSCFSSSPQAPHYPPPPSAIRDGAHVSDRAQAQAQAHLGHHLSTPSFPGCKVGKTTNTLTICTSHLGDKIDRACGNARHQECAAESESSSVLPPGEEVRSK